MKKTTKRVLSFALAVLMAFSISVPDGSYSRAEGEEVATCTEHTWDGGTVTKEATCGADGETTYTCSACGTTRTETIPATGNHNWDSGKVTKEATATEAGEMTYTCSACGATQTETIPATGVEHHWDEGTVTTPATCTADGVKTYKCMDDGCSETKTEAISAEHTWDAGVVTKQATADEAGVKTYTCTVCPATKTEEIPALGNHNWDEGTVTTPATCKTAGEITYKCTDAGCNATRTETISAAHTWDAGVVTTEATCKTKGVMTFTCTVCGETKTEDIDIDPDGHVWNDGEVTTKATCKTKGVKTYTCTVEGCGETKTEDIAIDPENHIWEITEIITEPTEDADGTANYTCKECSATKEDKLTYTDYMDFLASLDDISLAAIESSGYVYEITSDDRKATIEEIVKYFKENGTDEQKTDLKDFKPIFAQTKTGKVEVISDTTVKVEAGGDKSSNVVTIYDNASRTIDVCVWSAQTRIDSSYTDAKFEVQWNDNMDTGNRPSTDKAKGNYELQFSVDGGTYYSITELGNQTPISKDNVDYFDKIVALNDTLTSSEYLKDPDASKWTFVLSSVGLPHEYTKDGVTHTITYRIEQKAQYDGYTYLSATTDSERSNYALIGSPVINTKLNSYEATIQWNDNNNDYKTRPTEIGDNLAFTIYKLNTTVGSTITPISDALQKKATLTYDSATQKLSLSGLPAYDDSGNPVSYAIMATVNAIQPGGGSEGSAYDYYYDGYFNVDNFSSYENALFNGGKLVEQLANTTTFSYDKLWYEPSGNSNRGTPKIQLYVIAEDEIVNAASGTNLSELVSTKASAVQGYKAQAVPTTGGTKDQDDKYKTWFLDNALGGDLPLYDDTGRRLLYFALETDAPSNYTVSVDNSNSSIEGNKDAVVIAGFDTVKKNDQVKYVLNGGQITNSNTETIKVKAVVTLHAEALQKSSTVSSSYLTLQKYDTTTGAWVNVTYSEYVSGVPSGKSSTDAVTETLENIKGENYSVTVESGSLRKNDDKGNEIKYRYVENKFDLNKGTTGDMTWVSATEGSTMSFKTDHDYYTGTSAPGVNDEDVSMYLRGESNVNGHTTYIDNYIQAPMLIKVTKTWYDAGVDVTADMPDGAYVNVDVLKDGAYADDKYDLTLNNENEWIGYDKGDTVLDRFNKEGREYAYSIKEGDVNDGGYLDAKGITSEWNSRITSVKYRVVDTTTGEEATSATTETAVELVATIVNTYGKGSGIEVAVQKEWQDGGDISSEKNSTAALFYISDDEKTFGLVGNNDGPITFELNKENAWYRETTAGVSGMDQIWQYSDNLWSNTESLSGKTLSADNFVFVEIAANGVSHIWDGKTYESWTEDMISGVKEVKNGSTVSLGRVADDINDNSDKDGVSEYTYKVTEKWGKSVINTDCYTIVNTRVAYESYDLIKTWTDGGVKRNAKYVLYRSVNGSDPAAYITIETNGNVKHTDENDGVQVTITDSPAQSKFKKEIKIEKLPKYNETGELISYNLKETAIYDEGSKTWVDINNGQATVAGVNYSASLKIDTTKEDTESGTKFGTPHHNGDVTYWVGENDVSGSFDLNFYKVWYDQGPTKSNRPNVYFNIYRASTSYEFTDESGNKKTLYDWLESSSDTSSATQTFATMIYSAKDSIDAELIQTVTSDRYYDAGNDYCWNIDLGNMPRYDDNGYPYVYFMIEGGISSGSDYYGNEFYGDYTASDLPIHTTEKTPKAIYDIAGKTGGNLLIISDGVHAVDGDPGKYYSRTVVNRMKRSCYVSGKKIWNLPTGWTMADVDCPTVEFTLYRSTEQLKSASEDQTYTNADIQKWISAKKLEKVTDFTLNASSEDVGGSTNNKFSGNSYTIMYSDTEALTKLQKYDEYGTMYYYYVAENTADIPGYSADKVTYNTGTFHTDNNYSIVTPNVEISGQKTWKISAATLAKLKTGETFTGVDLAPVTITLYAQAVTSSGEALAGSDPIVIGKKELDPSKVTLTKTDDGDLEGTSKYTFKEYNGGMIPYYGPNGVPFKFYVTETTDAKTYASKIYYSTQSEDGSVSYTSENYTDSTIRYITLTQEGQTFKDVDDGKDASFENLYQPDTTDFSVQKIWSDNYVDNDDYRPDKVVFTIGRKVKGSDGTYADDAKYKKFTVELLKTSYPKNPTWTATSVEKPQLGGLDKYDPKGNEYQYYIVKEELYSLNKDTQEYTKIGEALSEKEMVGNYTLTKVENGKFTNTLTKNTSVKVTKNWLYNDGTTSSSDSTITWEKFEMMRSMNILPQSVTYVVERSTDGRTWNPVPAADVTGESKVVTLDGNQVLGFYIDIQGMTKSQYYVDKYLDGFTCQWDQLPTSLVGTSSTYSYRVVEYMTIKTSSGEEKTNEKYIGGESKYGVTSVIETTKDDKKNIWTSEAKNTVGTKKVRIGKIWDDNNGRDNTRPDKIQVTIKPLDSDGNPITAGLTYTLKAKGNDTSKDNANIYYSDYFYIAGDAKQTYGLDSGNGFEITETWTAANNATYTRVIKSTDEHDKSYVKTDSDGITFEIENDYGTSRKTISVEAKKTWADDTNFKNLTRPYIRFTLQYKTKDADEKDTWVSFTDDTIKDYEELPEGASYDKASYTFAPDVADKDLTHTWQNLKKYKDSPAKDGVAEPIEYRVLEELVKADGTVIKTKDANKTSYTSDKTDDAITYDGWDDDSKIAFTGTIKNTENLTEITLQKSWTKNGTNNKLTVAEVTKLVELGAIPNMIRYELQYYDTESSSWKNVHTLNNIDENPIKSSIEVATTVLIGTTPPRYQLPKYDKNGTEIQYRFVETGIRFGITWTTVDGTASQNIGSITVGNKAFKISDGKTVELTNDYEYTSKTITKNWVDENNRDGVRKDFSVTLYRDGTDDAHKYGDEISTANMGTSSVDNQWGTVNTKVDGKTNQWVITFDYLPMYKNGVTTHTDADKSVYTWSETKVASGYEKEHYSAISTETEETNVYEAQRGFVSATKKWTEDTGWEAVTESDSVKVKLQWSTTPKDETSWQDVEKGTLTSYEYTSDAQGSKKTITKYPDGDKVYTTTEIATDKTLTITRNTNGTYTTVMWENLPLNVNTSEAGTSKTVYYRVVEVTSTPGYKLESISNNDVQLVNGEVSAKEITNTLDYTTLTVKKNWKAKKGEDTVDLTDKDVINKLIALKAIPESVEVTIQYKIDGIDGATWQNIKNKDAEENSLATQQLTMAQLLAGYTFADLKLPKVDKENNPISYRVYESGVKYDGDESFTPVQWNWTDNGTGIIGSMSTTPSTTASYSKTDDKETAPAVTLTNTYEYVSKDITKIWEDESNREGARADFSVQLYRDGTDETHKYGTLISTDSLDGSITNQWGTVTKSIDGNTNQWQITYDYLPKYKAGATAHNAANESVYNWSETLPEGSNYAKANTGAVSTETAETNAYQSVRGSITVTKNWSDHNNALTTRPANIYLKLQWSVTPNEEDSWQDVQYKELETVNGKTVYKNAAANMCYTNTTLLTAKGQENWVEVAAAQNGTTQTFTWNNLSKYISVNGKTTDVMYRVIEGVLEGSTINQVDNETHKLANYTVTDAANVNIANIPDEQNPNATNGTTVTNELNSLAQLTVTKKWSKDSAYATLVRPTSVTFKVQYRAGESDSWHDIGSGYEDDIVNSTITIIGSNTEDTWTKTVDGLPSINSAGTALEYQVSETKITYGTGATATDVAVDGSKVGRYTYSIDPETGIASYDSSNKVYSVTAKNSLIVGKLSVTKTWADGKNRDEGEAAIQVQLYRDGKTFGSPVTLSSTTNPKYSYTWVNLPIYKDGSDYNAGNTKSTYYVREVDVDETTGKIKVSTNSVGEDIYYDVTYKDQVELSASTETKTSLTNTHNPFVFELDANKIWNGENTTLSVRPDSIVFELKYSLDGGQTWLGFDASQKVADVNAEAELDPTKPYMTSDAKQTVTGDKSSNQWTAKWNNLTANVLDKDGKAVEVQYKVVETVLDNYNNAAQMETEATSYSKRDKDTGIATVSLTNTLDTGKIVVSKKFTGNGSAIALEGDALYKLVVTDKILPEKITVTLKYTDPDGTLQTYGNSELVFNSTAKKYDSCSFENLPVKFSNGTTIQYTVTDSTGLGYIECGTVENVEATGDSGTAVTITNNYKNQGTSFHLGGSKQLMQGTVAQSLSGRTFEFKVTPQDNAPGSVETVKNDSTGAFRFSDVGIDGSNFINLGNGDTVEYKYLIEELQGGEANVTYDTGKVTATVTLEKVVTKDASSMRVKSITYTKNGSSVDSVNFTNILAPTETSFVLSGNKRLMRNGAQVNLNGKTFQFTLTPMNGAPGSTQTVTNNADGSFSFAAITVSGNNISGSSATFQYQIKEVQGSDSTITYDKTVVTATVVVSKSSNGASLNVDSISYSTGSAATFTNVQTPSDTRTFYTATKIWNDSNDKFQMRPTSITVHLFADGTEVGSTTLTAANGWSYTWENLPKKNAAGNDIAYSVTEDEITSYQTDIVPNGATMSTITNTYYYEIEENGIITRYDSEGRVLGARRGKVAGAGRTGDNAPIVFYGGSAAAAAALLLLWFKKRRKDNNKENHG